MKKNFVNLTVLILILFATSCRKKHDCCCKSEHCSCETTTCSCEPTCGCEKEKDYSKHFIAHAGGAIEGINYTNCLEVLDLSYSKGFKLFELDLVLTTDNKIVAAHDPPGITEAEFMSKLIEGKYTPMNMEVINNWFTNHKDAILVTDKIGDPDRIYNEFLFPDRLIMELWTWEMVDRAIELKIKPLVPEWILFSTPNIEQILEDKKIEYIGMSYWRIFGNEGLLWRLKKKGIKNYVWGLEQPINGLPAELYIWNNQMDYCYGMYANDLDILFLLNNAKL